MGFGNTLKILLKDRNMTIKELSEITGISVNTLYSITKRDTRLPSDEVLFKISQALGVEVTDLLTYDEIKTKIQDSIDNMDKSVNEINAVLSMHPEVVKDFSPEEIELILYFTEFIKNTRKHKKESEE